MDVEISSMASRRGRTAVVDESHGVGACKRVPALTHHLGLRRCDQATMLAEKPTADNASETRCSSAQLVLLTALP